MYDRICDRLPEEFKDRVKRTLAAPRAALREPATAAQLELGDGFRGSAQLGEVVRAH